MGADWKWHPLNSATLAFYRNKDKLNSNDETKNIVISNDYSLSKRTTVYADLVNVDPVAAGREKTGWDLGIRHNF